MKKLILGLLIAAHALLSAQTIAEKKAGLSHINSADLTPEMQKLLTQINNEHDALTKELQNLYAQAFELYKQHAPEFAFREILQKINTVKADILKIELQWQEAVKQTNSEGYALWQQPDTTLEQLVIDYGSQDYVYIFSPSIAEIPISVTSNLPIPRSSWGEMLELILTQNGVGIKQLNPFLRELYLLREDRSKLALITNQRRDLNIFPSNERVAFVLSPDPSDVRRVWFFLEKFVNPNSVVMQMIGRDILIVAQVSEVQEILKLYDFITTNRGQKEYKAISLNRVDADDMANILLAIFGGLNDESSIESLEISAKGNDKRGSSAKSKPTAPAPSSNRPNNGGGDNGLKVIPLSQLARAIFLVGTREEIHKAERIVADVENQVGESRGKEVWWYTTRHSDPEELADILQRIYFLLSSQQIGADNNEPNGEGQRQNVNIQIEEEQGPSIPLLPPPFASPFFLGPPINDLPPPMTREVNVGRDNFIVDLKTGTIVMVVETEILPRLQELICILDVPKKMVQLEVLLFEKRLNRQNNFGLNLLKIGTCASNTTKTCATFRDRGGGETVVGNVTTGIFDFFISRKENNAMPAFDLAYRFLLTQDDLHINSSPSVLAVNQTPAVIEIAEEISVNTGVFEIPTTNDITLKSAFARATYGIKIEIVPTIHVAADDGDPDSIDYVDMVTDITFQTFRSNLNDRPDVTTRHVLNEVSIPNGQTVILGGLRQRNSHDISEKIPFFGELPGIGKLFGSTQLEDDTTEMFIFITPTIVFDPVEDLARIRAIEMCRRPGDIPPFMCRLVAAQEREKYRLFAASMAMACGRKPDRCVVYPDGEYDGR